MSRLLHNSRADGVIYWCSYMIVIPTLTFICTHVPNNRSPWRVSIRIHGVEEGGSSYLLPDFPCQSECRTIYSRVSHLLGVPSALLTLSTGVKILRRRVPLQTYTSDLDLSNGLTLYCCISLPGGGSDDEGDEGEKDKPSEDHMSFSKTVCIGRLPLS